jgi:hypothetical protein
VLDQARVRTQDGRVAHGVDADYLVVGAGAAGMAFTDALIDHADVRVALVDRRHAPGGHWLDGYPFVRLHQSSSFYGVASRVLLDGAVQTDGPEAGLHQRATGAQVCAYYAEILQDRMVGTGRVAFYPNCDYLGGRQFVSSVSGQRFEVAERCRIVDAHYLAPLIPAHSPPPFAVRDGVRVMPVNDLVRLDAAPSRFVVVGSGKTATDACLWLIANGDDPPALGWVRPREPWMLNRAVVQPDPVTFLGMAAEIVATASDAVSLDEWFLRLEAAGIMLRIDPSLTPTMARAPTLGTWELDRLRTIEDVIRHGHLRAVEPGRLVFDDAEVAVPHDTVTLHCAAEGLRQPPLVPIWGREAITLQPIRAGFPVFGAALAGYLEATRDDDDEKNRLGPPSPFGNTLTDWARMQALGGRAVQTFGAEPDIKAWADRVALNPARIPPGTPPGPELDAVQARFREFVQPGLARLAELAGLTPSR